MNVERFLLPLNRLTEDGVAFVIVGGLAVVLHGHMRLTMDVDIAVSLEAENIVKLVASLDSLGFVPRLPVQLKEIIDPQKRADWIENKGMKALNLWRPPDPFSALDILIDLPCKFSQLDRDAIVIDLEGTKVKVASIDHLIEMKIEANRETDRGDVVALNMIKKRDEQKK